MHTALAFNVVGEDVLITGAGPIGLMGAAIVRKVGARYAVITVVNEERLKLAKERFGVTRSVNPAKEKLAAVMTELGMKEGFDVGLEMSGAPSAYRDMIAAMVNGGEIAVLGIPSREFPIDWNKVVFKSLTLKGIYGREMFETWSNRSLCSKTDWTLRRSSHTGFPSSALRRVSRRSSRAKQARSFSTSTRTRARGLASDHGPLGPVAAFVSVSNSALVNWRTRRRLSSVARQRKLPSSPGLDWRGAWRSGMAADRSIADPCKAVW